MIFYFSFTLIFYYRNNYKYVSLLLGYSDTTITNFFSISVVPFYIFTLLIASIWDKYGELYLIGTLLLTEVILLIMVFLG